MSTRISTTFRLRILVTLIVLVSGLGCGAVPKSVKSLIDVQVDKTATAKKATSTWTQAAPAQAKAFKDAIDALDEAMRAVQTEEAKYALVFSSNQNLASKKDIDAAAAAYLIGKLYLTDRAGLSSAVHEQFAESGAALIELSKQIDASWEKIGKLQGQLKEYADKSVIATVDVDFATALAGEIPGSNAKLGELLAQTKKLKQVLDQSTAVNLDGVGGVGQARTATDDLIELLEKISAKRAGQ